MHYIIKQFRSPRGCLSYVVSSGGEAAVIDPSTEVGSDVYLAYLSECNCTLRYSIETHTHADHISLGSTLKEKTGARILQHRNAPSTRKDQALEEGEIPLGESTLRVLETPGHTHDSICIVAGNAVFTGDTLLLGGTGRTDFQQGSSERLYDSLWNTLMKLPDDTVVYPAHNYNGEVSSTIKNERERNPRLHLDKTAFVETLDAHKPPKPDLFDEAININSV